MVKKSIPNIFTLSNLFCGFLSIGFAANGDFKNAAVLILIGMMLDSMDGRIARILNAQSDLGKELDSLADIVTFGVAPAILIYHISFSEFGLIGYMIAGLFPLFGAYRLARFNITSKNSNDFFTGVPITAAGGILTLLALLNHWLPNILINAIFMSLCFLMVSKLKIPSFKKVPLPKYGTIITLLLGYVLFLIIKSNDYPKFIYIAIPLYITFIGYRIKKGKQLNKNLNKKNKKTTKKASD